MSLSQLINRPCTLTRRSPSGARNQYGKRLPTQTTVETLCELQQQSRDEPGEAGEFGDTTWLLVLPAGTAIDTSDSVTVDGDVYELVGPPWEARNPRTRQVSHIEATVRRTAGASS